MVDELTQGLSDRLIAAAKKARIAAPLIRLYFSLPNEWRAELTVQRPNDNLYAHLVTGQGSSLEEAIQDCAHLAKHWIALGYSLRPPRGNTPNPIVY